MSGCLYFYMSIEVAKKKKTILFAPEAAPVFSFIRHWLPQVPYHCDSIFGPLFQTSSHDHSIDTFWSCGRATLQRYPQTKICKEEALQRHISNIHQRIPDIPVVLRGLYSLDACPRTMLTHVCSRRRGGTALCPPHWYSATSLGIPLISSVDFFLLIFSAIWISRGSSSSNCQFPFEVDSPLFDHTFVDIQTCKSASLEIDVSKYVSRITQRRGLPCLSEDAIPWRLLLSASGCPFPPLSRQVSDSPTNKPRTNLYTASMSLSTSVHMSMHNRRTSIPSI